MRLFKSGISLFLLLVFVFVQSVPYDNSSSSAKRTQALSPVLGASSQTSGTAGLIAAEDTYLSVAPGSQYSKIDVIRKTNSSNDRTSLIINGLRVLTTAILSTVGILAVTKVIGAWPEIVQAVEDGKEMIVTTVENISNNLGDPGTISDVFGNGLLILTIVFAAVVVNIRDFIVRVFKDIRAFWNEKVVITKYDKRLTVGYFVRGVIVAAILSFAIPAVPALWDIYMGWGAQLANFLITSEGVFPQIALVITGIQQVVAALFGLRVVKDVLHFLFPKILGEKERTSDDFMVELVPARVALKIAIKLVIGIVVIGGLVTFLIFLGPQVPVIIDGLAHNGRNAALLIGGMFAAILAVALPSEILVRIGLTHRKDMMVNPLINIYTYRRPGDPAPEKDEEPRVPDEALSVKDLNSKIERFLSYSRGAGLVDAEVDAVIAGKIAANAGSTESAVFAELKALVLDAHVFIENNMFNRNIRSTDKEMLRALVVSMLIVQWDKAPSAFGQDRTQTLRNISRALADVYVNPVISGSDTAYGFAKDGPFLKLISSKVRAKINCPLFVAALYHRLLEHNISSFVPDSMAAEHAKGRALYERQQVFSFVDSLPVRVSYMNEQFDALFGAGAYESCKAEEAAQASEYFEVDMGDLEFLQYDKFMDSFGALFTAA